MYPTTNRNGSWLRYNITTKSCMPRSQWKKLPTPQLNIDIMNEQAGIKGVSIADLPSSKAPQEDAPMIEVHDLAATGGAIMQENLPEAMVIIQDNFTGVPDLVDNGDDSDSKSSKSDPDQDFEDLDDVPEQEQLQSLLDEEFDVKKKAEESMRPPLRRSGIPTVDAGKLDDQYKWNLLNLSVGEEVRAFGERATQACKANLKQLFLEKKALVLVKWSELNHKQKRNTNRLHMFLKEKYEDGQFVKLKACLVADGRMQDRNAYTD